MSELTEAQRTSIAGATVSNTSVAQLSANVDMVVAASLLAEWVVNFDHIAGGAGNQIAIEILGNADMVATGDNTGVFKVTTGGTKGTAGGTSRVSYGPSGFNTSNETRGATGSSFSNPGGNLVVQLQAVAGAGASGLTSATMHCVHIKIGAP